MTFFQKTIDVTKKGLLCSGLLLIGVCAGGIAQQQSDIKDALQADAGHYDMKTGAFKFGSAPEVVEKMPAVVAAMAETSKKEKQNGKNR